MSRNHNLSQSEFSHDSYHGLTEDESMSSSFFGNDELPRNVRNGAGNLHSWSDWRGENPNPASTTNNSTGVQNSRQPSESTITNPLSPDDLRTSNLESISSLVDRTNPIEVPRPTYDLLESNNNLVSHHHTHGDNNHHNNLSSFSRRYSNHNFKNSNRHDSTSEYPKQQELIDLILKARIAFQRTSEGMRKFDELIEKVKDMTSSEFNRQLKNKLAAPIVDYRIQTVRSTYPTANNQGPTPQAGSWGAHDFQ